MTKETNQATIEIFAMDHNNIAPIAFSLDPDATSTERLRMIVHAQIMRVDPKIIFCNVGGVYDEISDSEFDKARGASDEDIKDFTEEILDVLKGPYTSDIIISNPRKTNT